MAFETNNNRDYMGDSYNDNKLSKKMELNPSMTISGSAPDQYSQTVENRNGGTTNDN